jgi:N-methylhydantoinase B/oxoprolinase/acetone carboxylase alpha subunit
MADGSAHALLDSLRANGEDASGISCSNWPRPVFTALFSSDLQSSLTTAVELLPSFAGAVASVRDFFGSRWAAGDVGITNDADAGASNAAEMIVVAPIMGPGVVQGWAAARGRVPDFGGWERGGYSPQAVDRWAEGARIEPAKIMIHGALRREVADLLMLNSRTPNATLRAVLDIIDFAGAATKEIPSWLDDYSRFREVETARIDSALGALSRDAHVVEQTLSSLAGGAALSIAVHQQRDGKRLKVRLEAPPVAASHVNLGRHGTADMVHAALAAVLGAPALCTDALSSRVSIDVREPSLTSAPVPSPVGLGRETTGLAIFRATLGALAKAGLGSDIDRAERVYVSRIFGGGRVDLSTGKLLPDQATAVGTLMMEARTQ